MLWRLRVRLLRQASCAMRGKQTVSTHFQANQALRMALGQKEQTQVTIVRKNF